MKKAVKAKRTYDSTRRRGQAAETRERILEAARGLFTARGWHGTTIDAIARDAGVAAETVYAAFRSKRGLLARLVEVAVRGDARPASLMEREGPKAAIGAGDPQQQIRMFAEDIRPRLERVAPLLAVIRAAASTDEEMAVVFRGLHEGRLRNLTAFVRAVARHGELRGGLRESEAAETVWALASPELFRLLTETRGWSGERYSRWLGDALAALLLPV